MSHSSVELLGCSLSDGFEREKSVPRTFGGRALEDGCAERLRTERYYGLAALDIDPQRST